MAGEEGACVAGVCVVGTCVFMVGGHAWLRHVWFGACMAGMGVYVGWRTCMAGGGACLLVSGYVWQGGMHGWGGGMCGVCVCVCVCVCGFMAGGVHGWGGGMYGWGCAWLICSKNSPFRTTFNSQSR